MSRTLTVLCVLGLATAALAGTAGVDTRLSPQTFEDQHGEAHSLDAAVRLVVFTRDMDAGDVVKAALADTPGEALAGKGIAYVADISGMPALVARLFALPAMRRRAYPMWLDRDGTKTAELPSEEGRVTVLRLDALEVRSVSFVAEEAKLRELLGLGPAPER
jgi:hypothetical protein